MSAASSAVVIPMKGTVRTDPSTQCRPCTRSPDEQVKTPVLLPLEAGGGVDEVGSRANTGGRMSEGEGAEQLPSDRDRTEPRTQDPYAAAPKHDPASPSWRYAGLRWLTDRLDGSGRPKG